MPLNESMDDAVPFQILSLSGGGYLGLYSVGVLAEVERLRKQPIAPCFDLLCGTSIGGIIALALAADIPPARIQQAFEENGPRIFGSANLSTSKLGASLDVLRKMFRSRYRADALRSTIVDIVGDNLLIGDLKRRVLVPAVNLTKGLPQVFKTPHHPTFKRDLHIRVVDVAMATAAAPTFFPLAEIGNSLFADGGLYANSPDILGLHEAMHFLEQDISQVKILSVGTTTAQFSLPHLPNKKLGVAQWFSGNRLLNVIMASQQSSVDFMLRHRLGTNYLRLDEVQSKEQQGVLAMDTASVGATKTILAIAEGTGQRAINEKLLVEILRHSAPAPKFF